MGVTVTNVLAGSYTKIADITATLDADTTATIAHGLGVIPLEVAITPLLQAPAALSAWAATTIDATNVVLTKSTAGSSGNANPQIRCIIKAPHSIGK